ncbi:MAG TPA: response regulator [Opitutaceae bacterium]
MIPKILIVDDDPANLLTMEACLGDEGYQLLLLDEGREAPATARREQADLILLDVMTPGMDGFAVTRQIRSDPAIGRIPIILITALGDEASRIEGLRAGADDFVTKPCGREELRARVRTVTSLNRFRLLAEQRARFEGLFAATPAAIVVVDSQGRVLAANARAQELNVGEWFYASFEAPAAAVLRALLAGALAGEATRTGEVRRGHGAGERIYQVQAVMTPDQAAPTVMFVCEDRTAETRAREALARMNTELETQVRARTRQLEEANGLLMSYAKFVSHDLRSPLAVLKGYLSLLRDGLVPLDGGAAPMIGTMYDATEMMDELIENMLRLAEAEHAGDPCAAEVAVDPTPVLQKLATRMRELFPRPAPRFEIGALPPVGVNAVLLERVFYNLFVNAVKYSSHRAEPLVEVGAIESEEGPVLFVRDNGVGFDARDAEKLFREFSRLPGAESSDGFGLGLSLVARLLSLHGGHIWAEGVAGAGATFYVRLPRAASGGERERSPQAAALAGAEG